jgi:hypothetical protein
MEDYFVLKEDASDHTHYTGAYNAATTYNAGEEVSYAGSTWICLIGCVNQTPALGSSYWAIRASKGDSSAALAWHDGYTVGHSYVASTDVCSNWVSGRKVLYLCILNHTGAAADEPGIGANWATYWAVMADPGSATAEGWTGISDTWVYSGSDDPVYTFAVAGNKVTDFAVGSRIKLTQSATVKYFIVVGATYSAPNTVVSIYGGTDYDLENATISATYLSYQRYPLGFPASPAKWTVSYTDTSDRTQATPTQNTWYNLGTLTISLPVGIWYVSWFAFMNATRSTSAYNMFATLSTGNNTESDRLLTRGQAGNSGTDIQVSLQVTNYLVSAATKTSYYLNARTTKSSATNLKFLGATLTTVIRAVCAYL